MRPSFFIAYVVLVTLFAVVKAQFVPAVPYSWSSEFTVRSWEFYDNHKVFGICKSSYLIGMHRVDLHSGEAQLNRNNTQYNLNMKQCTKTDHVPNINPFWWAALAVYESHDFEAGCYKYVLDLDSLPGLPSVTGEIVGCFSDYQTPVYILTRTKLGDFETKVDFRNFVPGPQDSNWFRLPHHCPPIDKGSSLSVDDTKLDQYRKGLAIAKKLLTGDFFPRTN